MGAAGLRRRELLAAGAGALSTAHLSRAQDLASATDLVVLVPGITGSTLTVNGKPVWAPSALGIVSALISMGANLRSLTLQHDDLSRDTLDDGVEATGLVEDIHLIPGLWKIDGYSKAIERLTSLPGIKRSENFHAFAYDWRRDNRVAAARLKTAANAWLEAWRRKTGNADAKIVILAHSMGGLVARYFIECLEGWRSTRSLVTFGTPYRGAPVALRVLTQGLNLGVSLSEVSQLVRSFTSVYQLLPTYSCIERGGQLRRVSEVSDLPHVVAKKVHEARAFHDEMNAAVARNRQNDDFLKSGYVCLPVVGVLQETVQLASLAGGNLSFSFLDPRQSLQGDGTVPRPSATPIELERLNAENFVNEVHGSLQNSDRVLLKVASMIASNETQWGHYRGPWNSQPSAISSFKVGADSLQLGKSQLFVGRADPREYLPTVDIEVTDSYTGKVTHQETVLADESGQFRGAIGTGSLVVGAYRIRAMFSRRTQVAFESISDVFCVLPS